MVLDSSSFNLLVSNLLIGLFKKHKFLTPLSDEIFGFGYKICSIEPYFNSLEGKVNPDAIADSEIASHTLILEWTSARSLSQRKHSQVDKYLKITPGELSSQSIDSDSSSVWLIVQPSAVTSFKSLFSEENKAKLLLSSFEISEDGNYILQITHGSILDNNLYECLSKSLTFEKIPEGYILINLDNLQDSRLMEMVYQTVISFVVKRNKNFKIEEICRSILPIWDIFDVHKQKEIESVIRKLMMKIYEADNNSNKLLTYTYPYWIVNEFSQQRLLKFMTSLDNV